MTATMHLIVGCRRCVIRWRIILAAWIFPANRGRVCANRSERSYETDSMAVSFCIRDKRESDGYSWEEVMRILDIFLGRKTTPEEWQALLAWKRMSERQGSE